MREDLEVCAKSKINRYIPDKSVKAHVVTKPLKIELKDLEKSFLD
jgi:hypothetical protein